MKPIQFFFDKKEYFIKKTKHLYENRGESSVERQRFISDRILKDVLIYSFSRGLTSFRDKGTITITYFNTKRLQTTLLVELNSENIITFITLYGEGKVKKFRDHFVKVKNRIYLDKVFDIVSKDEFTQNKKDKMMNDIDIQCRKEDFMFRCKIV